MESDSCCALPNLTSRWIGLGRARSKTSSWASRPSLEEKGIGCRNVFFAMSSSPGPAFTENRVRSVQRTVSIPSGPRSETESSVRAWIRPSISTAASAADAAQAASAPMTGHRRRRIDLTRRMAMFSVILEDAPRSKIVRFASPYNSLKQEPCPMRRAGVDRGCDPGHRKHSIKRNTHVMTSRGRGGILRP
jgi:hypothetical protein